MTVIPINWADSILESQQLLRLAHLLLGFNGLMVVAEMICRKMTLVDLRCSRHTSKPAS
jgi:hypothetical protein